LSCWLLCCCHIVAVVFIYFVAALPTLPPPPPPPLPSVGKEDDACYTNANISLATLAQADCQALESRASLDRPLLADRVGGKGSDDDGGTNGGGRSRIAYWISMVLPSPTQGGTTATRVAGK
jgi:hypothetical protein